MELEELEKLREYIRNLKEVTITFSGGVDSSLLCKIAHKELGKKAVAVTIASEFSSEEDILNSIKIAQEIGIKHKIVKINVLDEEIEKNDEERCYLCKCRMLSSIEGKNIADGTNADDCDSRPGIFALEEFGIHSPLKYCGLGKEKIRKLAKENGLPNYSKPSNSCLATRIPFHSRITKEKLEKIEAAEKILNEKGIWDVRARLNKNVFFLEIPSKYLKNYKECQEEIEDKIYKLNIEDIKLEERK